MEYGFYHPDRGYWQAIDGDPTELLASYPAGTVQVPLKPGANYEWQDGVWVKLPELPPPVPESVTRAQAKVALYRAGLLDQVESAVSAAGGEVSIWYADAVNWSRNNPNVIALGALLGLTTEVIDGLFLMASEIED